MATDVWGICMARNEADIIGGVVAHMTDQVDHVLVADNLSTDDTASIAAAAGAEVVTDPDPAYTQSVKMTALAARAAAEGARWVVPFDADEVWTTTSGDRIGDVLASQSDEIVAADLFDYVTTDLDDATDLDPLTRIRWRRTTPARLPKVAVRTDPHLSIAMGNHAADYGDRHPDTVTGLLTIRHYPHRSPAQFVSKVRQGAAALRLARLPLNVGAHWRDFGRILERDGEAGLIDYYLTWFHSPDPAGDATLTLDPL